MSGNHPKADKDILTSRPLGPFSVSDKKPSFAAIPFSEQLLRTREVGQAEYANTLSRTCIGDHMAPG